MELSTTIVAQPASQAKRPYRSPRLEDYGTVQGLTASGSGAINEAGQPGSIYANSI